jgi:hypothetical protein
MSMAAKACVLLALALGAQAVPSVNVALRTSFNAPPLLVELLYVAKERHGQLFD